MIGATWAHYRVTAKIGEGGMGEVWRVEDTKLGREVALKVLPEESAADPDRMAGFERETPYVYRSGELPARVSLVDVTDGSRRPWQDLEPSDIARIFGIDYLAVNPGGDGYVYSYRRLLSTLYVIEGLR